MDDPRQMWRALLESIVYVILFVNKQNIPFRGHRVSFESKNQGSFLEAVKLLAKYNAALNKRLSDTQLSDTSSPLIILQLFKISLFLFSEKVKPLFFDHYAVMCDRIPDVSYTDQIAFIFKYVTTEKGKTQTSLHVRSIRSRATGARYRHRRICKSKPSQVEILALNGGWHVWTTTTKLMRFFSICFTKCFRNKSESVSKTKIIYF